MRNLILSALLLLPPLLGFSQQKVNYVLRVSYDYTYSSDEGYDATFLIPLGRQIDTARISHFVANNDSLLTLLNDLSNRIYFTEEVIADIELTDPFCAYDFLKECSLDSIESAIARLNLYFADKSHIIKRYESTYLHSAESSETLRFELYSVDISAKPAEVFVYRKCVLFKVENSHITKDRILNRCNANVLLRFVPISY